MPNIDAPLGGSMGAAIAVLGRATTAADETSAEDRLNLADACGCGNWPPPVGAVATGVGAGGSVGWITTTEWTATAAGLVTTEGTTLAVVGPEPAGGFAAGAADVGGVTRRLADGVTDVLVDSLGWPPTVDGPAGVVPTRVGPAGVVLTGDGSSGVEVAELEGTGEGLWCGQWRRWCLFPGSRSLLGWHEAPVGRQSEW